MRIEDIKVGQRVCCTGGACTFRGLGGDLYLHSISEPGCN